MKNKIELLAPGGDVDSIKAAITAGADAVFCGLDKFNARNRAENINIDNLQGILSLAHKHNCAIFLTLNILILDNEIPALIKLLNKLVNTSVDGIIVQDIGVFHILKKHFSSLKVHASTQCTTHNNGQILFLKKLKVERVNLSRELNIKEIKLLTEVAHNSGILTEVFVHGSYCISFSGLCYMSSVRGGNSGNRGRCSQPCRDQYLTTPNGKDYPLNLKDNSAFLDLNELAYAGVDSLKIEGRIKKSHYVYTIVNAWRKQLNSFYSKGELATNKSELYKVFNRDFSNGFLKNEMGKGMYIDNARSNSAIYLAASKGVANAENIEDAKQEMFAEKTAMVKHVRHKIDHLSIEKDSLYIHISGELGQPLKVKIKTPDKEFVVSSKTALSNKGTESLNKELILKRFKTFDETEYYIKSIELNDLEPNVFLPFKELTEIKKQVLFHLNHAKQWINPHGIPSIKKVNVKNLKPKLAVLLANEDDLAIINNASIIIYFKLPNNLNNELDKYIDLFKDHKQLIPWFPEVLIGENYNAAERFINELKPKTIVANNTGIIYLANVLKVNCIAGPQLNIVNLYSLTCLKEEFNCSGAFISNEINRMQIKNIKPPTNFELHFSIYHPIELMTSRQCLFQQVTGCEKSKVDDACLNNCEKSASISNLNEKTSFIHKTKGNFNKLYNQQNYLNTDIVNDVQNKFSSSLIDLSTIKTDTELTVDKRTLINLFESHLNGDEGAQENLHKAILNTTAHQYHSNKGI